MNSIELCITHQGNVYVQFLRCLARYWECNKKIEQNYLDGSAFAIVFIRAKHTAPVQLCSLWNFEHTVSRLLLTHDL